MATSVVGLGGGHGLPVVLEAARRYARGITAVVNVADDGGSSGRLRQVRGGPAPGDVRRCLAALAEDPAEVAAAMEHRFSGGELDGHALGNLILTGLAELHGDFGEGVARAGRLLRTVGAVLPATSAPVQLVAETDGGPLRGQVAISQHPGIRRVWVEPVVPAHPRARDAIAAAGQIVLAPGSLYTSVLPVAGHPDLVAALAQARGRVVMVCNLAPQAPETAGRDGHDLLAAVLDHGVRVDELVYDPEAPLPVDPDTVRGLGVEPVPARVASDAGGAHDPERLAAALAGRVPSGEPA